MVQFCYIRLYLGIENVSCRLLLQMAMPAKITPKLLWVVFPDEKCLISFLTLYRSNLFNPLSANTDQH